MELEQRMKSTPVNKTMTKLWRHRVTDRFCRSHITVAVAAARCKVVARSLQLRRSHSVVADAVIAYRRHIAVIIVNNALKAPLDDWWEGFECVKKKRRVNLERYTSPCVCVGTVGGPWPHLAGEPKRRDSPHRRIIPQLIPGGTLTAPSSGRCLHYDISLLYTARQWSLIEMRSVQNIGVKTLEKWIKKR